MIRITRTQAEKRFADIEKRQQAILSEKSEAAAAVRKKTSKLRALRLQREAEDLMDRQDGK